MKKGSSPGMGAINNSETFSAVSLSGGKDSSCLLLLMIEKGLPIDCVLYADTGMEFPEMEAHSAKLDDFLYQERGIHITTLRHPHGFEWMMFERPVNRAPGRSPKGYGWPLAAPGRRWCTGHLKQHLISKEVNRLKKEKTRSILSASLPMKPTAARTIPTTVIPWWSGASPRPRPSSSAITGATIGAGCTRYTVEPHAGAFHNLGNKIIRVKSLWP